MFAFTDFPWVLRHGWIYAISDDLEWPVSSFTYSKPFQIALFTERCHASTVYAVFMCLSVCLSVTSSVLLKRLSIGSRKQCHTIAQRLLDFWCRRSRQNSNGVTPSGGPKCRWGRFKWQLTRCNLKTSSIASVINLVRSQVYYTERPPLFAARLLWCQHVARFRQR